MDSVIDAFRNASRSIRRAPGVSLVIVLTIALGGGANIALYSAFHALVLRPVVTGTPDPLLMVSRVSPTGLARPMPIATIGEFTRHQTVFDELCGYAGGALLTVEVDGTPAPAILEFIAGPYYSVLGVRPFRGRLLSTEDAPFAGEPAPAAVLGYDFWRQHFADGEAVVGRTIRVEGVPLTIVGVTPRGFSGLQVDIAPSVTIPAALFERLIDAPPNPRRLPQVSTIVGRLRPGASLRDARREVAAVWPRVQAATVPAAFDLKEQDEFRSMRASVEPIDAGFSSLRRSYAQPVRMLVALTGVLLVIACVNLAGLLRARAAAREHEIAVHLALGASRRRLVSHLITETLVLSFIGAGLALPLAWWGSRALGIALWDGFVPMTLRLTPDARVLGLTVVTAAGIGIGLGLLPAWRATRQGLHRHLALVRSSAPASPSGKPLVIGQLAMSLTLVFAACLFARSLIHLETLDPGFRVEDVLLAKLTPQPGGYRSVDPSTYYPELVRRLSMLPGVRTVSLSRLFTGAIDERAAAHTVALSEAGEIEHVSAAMDLISPSFFDTVGIPLLQGRDFTWRDSREQPAVAIVNQRLARDLLSPESVVGRHIRIGTDPARQFVEVVGIVGDASMGNLRSVHLPVVFRPALQEPQFRRPLVEIHAPAAGAVPLADSVRRTVLALGREYVLHVGTLENELHRMLTRERIVVVLSATFAGLALLLAFLGVYGLLSYAVTYRTREIGVRMAVGASRAAVLRMIVREAALMTLAGLAIGIPFALATGRLAGALLFEVTAWDGGALAAAVGLLTVVGLAAGLSPGLRASGVEPKQALHVE
ncbi:MAG: ADOP family duplicated permease [Vicinamibacterales bacterium]